MPSTGDMQVNFNLFSGPRHSAVPNAEEKISPFRLACLVCAIFVYVAFPYHPLIHSPHTLPLLIVLGIYSSLVHLGRPYRLLPFPYAEILITVLDGIFCGLWLWTTGGAASPFFVVMFAAITTVSLRFSMGPTMLAALFYVAMYSYLYLLAPEKVPLADFVIRNSLLFIVGGIGGLLSRLVRDRNRKLAIINRSLEKENLRRRRSETGLRRKQEELAAADKKKDEFLAMLAHELRNPLASMYAAVDILSQREVPGDLREEAIGSLHKRLHDLVRMVDDLLEVSRVTKGKILLLRDRVELATIILDSVHLLRDEFERQGHFLHFNPAVAAGIFVNGDRTRLEQVFTNLLQNAIKYTDPRGHIWILVSSANGNVTVRIKDSGIGMDKEVVEKIFGLFVQCDSSLDRSRGGLGIGLTLVRQLVHEHGGTIRASSDGPGTGSEFSVVLPIVEAQTRPDPVLHTSPEAMNLKKPSLAVVPASHQYIGDTELNRANEAQRASFLADKSELFAQIALPVADESIRTLLVEDAPDVALLMSALLRRWGYIVDVATDGEMALQMFQEARPRIVLLDIGLPKIDGYEVARRIRNEIRDPDSILIALTGYGRAIDRERARACGFNIHLTKPVPPPLLKRLLGEAVRV